MSKHLLNMPKQHRKEVLPPPPSYQPTGKAIRKCVGGQRGRVLRQLIKSTEERSEEEGEADTIADWSKITTDCSGTCNS